MMVVKSCLIRMRFISVSSGKSHRKIHVYFFILVYFNFSQQNLVRLWQTFLLPSPSNKSNRSILSLTFPTLKIRVWIGIIKGYFYLFKGTWCLSICLDSQMNTIFSWMWSCILAQFNFFITRNNQSEWISQCVILTIDNICDTSGIIILSCHSIELHSKKINDFKTLKSKNITSESFISMNWFEFIKVSVFKHQINK